MKNSKSVDEYRLYAWHELPEYQKFNQFVTFGYRCNFSWKQCVLSLFRFHNESGNIWSHLIGALLFMFFTVNAFMGSIWEQPFWGRVHFLIFLFSAQYSFGTSTLYHLFMCHSEKTLWRFLRLDYSGIAALIVGSYFSPIFYGYYCFPFWQRLYLLMISVVGISLVVLCLFKFFHTNRYATMRLVLYSLIAAFGIIPALHIRYLTDSYLHTPDILVHNIDDVHFRINLMYLCYFLGVICYMYQLPERFFPGKFDYLFHSHQLWHLFTFAGILIHHGTLVMIFENWRVIAPDGVCLRSQIPKVTDYTFS